MTINHHPDESMLAAYAAGALDLGQHVAIATHLTSCVRCRAWQRSLERVGGALLESSPPMALADGALERTMARLDEPSAALDPTVAVAQDAPAQLPRFVKHYKFGPWRRVAPRVSLRPIELPTPSPTRVFLLRSAPGTRLLHHDHTGLEMTCVLSGAFAHERGRYAAGDFDIGDPSIAHEPRVEAGVDCVCLVAMEGDLRLRGVMGRLMQPFVRL